MEKIIEYLKEIERKKNVRILYACETGSRAWGFPSPDSDYDVRFIYMHERDWYLSLNKGRDSMEFAIENDFDITGWDLKKSLVLLKKSNAPLIERFQSPVEYFSGPAFRDEFKSLITAYYSPTAVFYHHFSLAKKFWEDIKDKEEIRLKNYFYLLRSLLSCNWIIKDKSVVPMHIEGLMTQIDGSVRGEIRKLITLKATVGEKYLHPADISLNQWIEEIWSVLENSKNDLEVNSADYSLLNQFFLKSLYAKDDDRMG
ncbi:MAG: nucleotidyltransferase domain-containing protein [Chitinophagaceae bacterium]